MGSNTSKQSEQLSQQNAAQAAQQQKQNATLDQVNSSLSPYLSGNKGFTDAQMAALNSSALDQNAQQYNAAGNQLRQQLQARGENGGSPLSGTGVSGIAGLLSGKASDLANSLRTNVLNNAQQGLTNQFNANSILSGNAQTLAGNVGTYGSGASNALSNYTQAQAASPLNQFLGGLGKGLGTAGAIGISGGLGSALSGNGFGSGVSDAFNWNNK